MEREEAETGDDQVILYLPWRVRFFRSIRDDKGLYLTIFFLLVAIICTLGFFSFIGIKQPLGKVKHHHHTETNVTTSKFLFVHLTDVHGWVAGHPHNETLNADFGDLVSLVEHLSEDETRTVLVIDSGDVIEGTGLSDVSTIDGQYIFPIFQKIPNFAALTIGNHDIGNADSLEYMENDFIPFFNSEATDVKGRYLTSNCLDSTGDPIGNYYDVRTTSDGVHILLLGFLYDFRYNAPNSTVVPVSAAVNQTWFIEAMTRETADIIIVTCHIDPQSTNLNQIYNAIRKYHAKTPLVIFSGHRHILYYSNPDSQAHTIESGKYFEHIGIVSFEFSEKKIKNFDYQWVETSLTNFYNLSGTTEENFLTSAGNETKQLIQEYSTLLNLTETLGCSKITYDSYVDISSPNSLYSLYINTVVPTIVVNNTLPNQAFFITNSATLRYDLYAGKVDLNDIFTLNPFKDVYYYFPSVPGSNLTALVSHVSYKSKEYAPERTPYFQIGKAVTSYDDPFYYSNITINDSQLYDVICADYDSVSLSGYIQDTFNITRLIYPTEVDSTTAWKMYTIQYLPCSSDCLC